MNIEYEGIGMGEGRTFRKRREVSGGEGRKRGSGCDCEGQSGYKRGERD